MLDHLAGFSSYIGMDRTATSGFDVFDASESGAELQIGVALDAAPVCLLPEGHCFLLSQHKQECDLRRRRT